MITAKHYTDCLYFMTKGPGGRLGSCSNFSLVSWSKKVLFIHFRPSASPGVTLALARYRAHSFRVVLPPFCPALNRRLVGFQPREAEKGEHLGHLAGVAAYKALGEEQSASWAAKKCVIL